MKVAIIAGHGDFPIQIARENPEAFVLCIEDHSFTSKFENNSDVVSLKDPSSWISVLKKNKITHLVMAGKINRISNEKFHDNKLSHDLIKKTFSLGDNSALRLIEKFFNQHGFEIIPVTSILKDCFFSKGFYKENFFSTKLKDFVIKNAQFGSNFLNKMLNLTLVS